MKETYKGGDLKVIVHFLENSPFSLFVVYLKERLFRIFLVSVQIRDSFIELNSLTGYQKSSSGPKFLILITFILSLGRNIQPQSQRLNPVLKLLAYALQHLPGSLSNFPMVQAVGLSFPQMGQILIGWAVEEAVVEVGLQGGVVREHVQPTFFAVRAWNLMLACG